MLGFLIGTVCLIGLIKVARGHHYRYGYGGCGSGRWEGPSGWGGHPRSSCDGGGGDYRDDRGGWGRRGGFGPRMFLRGIFERLDTTPGQEKVIVQAASELKSIFAKAKEEMKGTRTDFARVIRGDSVDEASVADIFMKHDTVISETRRGAVEAARKIHDALTEEQRKQVADLIEQGPRFGGRWGRRDRGHWV